MRAFRLVFAILLVWGGLIAQLLTPTSALAQPGDGELAVLNTQVSQLYGAGKYSEAIPIALRAIELAERIHGPDHSAMGQALNSLADLYRAQGRFAEAEPLYLRSLTIIEKALGPAHPSIASSLSNLAELHSALGRYAEAEALFRRAVPIREKALGPDHVDVGALLKKLADVYQLLGRPDADTLNKRALGILEKALGSDDPSVFDNVAELYASQGRYAEADVLFNRALSIRQKALGSNHPDVALSLKSLAELYRWQGRVAEVEPLYLRSLSILETVLGPDHPSVGTTLNNLALIYNSQGRYVEAEPLYLRSLNILEAALGSVHPSVGTSLANLAGLLESQGRYVEAESTYRRALAIREKAFGPDHPDVARALGKLGALKFGQQDWSDAVKYLTRGTDVTLRVAMRTSFTQAPIPSTRETVREEWRQSPAFVLLVKAAHRLAQLESTRAVELAAHMFQIAQWASGWEVSPPPSPKITTVVLSGRSLYDLARERDFLVAEWKGRTKLLIDSFSQSPDKRETSREQVQRTRLAAIEARFAEIDRRLARDYPDYASLASPRPLTLDELREQLRADEAVLFLLDTSEQGPAPEETFVWVITKTESRWVRSELGTKALTERVAALRCGLDHTLWYGEHARRCFDHLKARPADEIVAGQMTRVLPFDLARAHELYKALLGPAEDMIKGKHLLVVPSGPLTSLPFSVLVTEPPKTAIPAKLDDYREVAWLGTRQAITVLPSVSTLRAVRRSLSRAPKSYLGIGNPLIDGPQHDLQSRAHWRKLAQEARVKTCSKQPARVVRVASAEQRSGGSFASLFRGQHADIEKVREWSPLPETADELCEVGRQLSAPVSDIYLGARATETTLKDMSEKGKLAQYSVVHLATHGALTGQVQGSAEPGLILTPPPKGTTDAKKLERDDGFLTSSEIATLRLDANWVVLSACNTAAGATRGENAEALSGLARAFFYAGARALLVSPGRSARTPPSSLQRAPLPNSKKSPRSVAPRRFASLCARLSRRGSRGRRILSSGRRSWWWVKAGAADRCPSVLLATSGFGTLRPFAALHKFVRYQG